MRTDFDLVWRGYDRDQVQHYVHGVEADLHLVAVDRDAAVARAEELARQLEAARTDNRKLRERIDRLCQSPIEPEAMTERFRRMAELAHEEAAEITAQARVAAGHSWSIASQAAGRLRRRAEHLVGELERRRREMEAEHRELMDHARQQVRTMTRQAEQRRRELDEQSAQLRRQVESDFELAMAARRTEAMAALAEQHRAAESQADQVVSEATEHAHRIVADARRTVDGLRHHRDRLVGVLRSTRRLFADAEPLLRPTPEEPATPQPEPPRPRSAAEPAMAERTGPAGGPQPPG